MSSFKSGTLWHFASNFGNTDPPGRPRSPFRKKVVPHADVPRNNHSMNSNITYVVTDIEADGRVPGRNSMLCLASVACDANGREIASFEANLRPLPGAVQNPDTMKWWATEPEAWAYCQQNQRDPADVMKEYAGWLDGLPGEKLFVAHPSWFDFAWVFRYLMTFVGERKFRLNPFDLLTYAHATTGWDFETAHRRNWPEEWFGGHLHSHRAIDDARGYAAALARLLAMNAELDRRNAGIPPK